MDYPQTMVSGNESAGCNEPLQEASTQTTCCEYNRDASTQTSEDDLSVIVQPATTSKTSEESRKKKISNNQEVAHGSNVAKLPRKETSEMSDQFVSTSSEEGYRNGSPLCQQPPVEKEHTCLTCKKTTAEHVVLLTGKEMYRCCHRCCRCLFISDNFESLQMHIFNEHTQPFYCDVCHMNYSETSSHARDEKCEICKQSFECKYQSEERYTLVHKDLHKTHCRICKKDFEEHNIFKNKVLYKCCFKGCDFMFNSTSSFNQHLSKHSRLKALKCEVCGYYFKRPIRF